MRAERKSILDSLAVAIHKQIEMHEYSNLNFICTHNSRRSQFSQIWAQIAAYENNLPIRCYSGGVEVTACNERVIASLIRSGLHVSSHGTEENPVYFIRKRWADSPIQAFSKIFDDPYNPSKNFLAIMTCAHADDNCPFIPGADQRIPVRYVDPKVSDDTEDEIMTYDDRSAQIRNEMDYVMKAVSQFLNK